MEKTLGVELSPIIKRSQMGWNQQPAQKNLQPCSPAARPALFSEVCQWHCRQIPMGSRLLQWGNWEGHCQKFQEGSTTNRKKRRNAGLTCTSNALKKTTSILVNRCVIHYVFIFDITSGVQSSCTNEAPIIDPLSLIELWYSKQTGAAQRLLSCSFHVHVTHRSYPSTSPNPQFLWGRTLANPILVQLMS